VNTLKQVVGGALLGISFLVAGLSVEGGGSLAAQAAASFRVVVNESNPVTTISADDLSALFLKRRTSWPGGVRAQPVDQPARAAVRESFSTVALDRPVRAMVAYWQQQIFSGRGVPPLELATETAVVEYVRANAGAVGYVSAGADIRGLKAVEVTR
jgi:ABC-type phosphate transport system substrate-binding protein